MNHIKQLTFLRFLAALLVVVFHFGKDTWPFYHPALVSVIHEGSIAVSFFFFLSGTVLSLTYPPDSPFRLREFIVKRIARIYPVYLLAFLAALILGMMLNHAYPKGGSILLQLFALHAWAPGLCLEMNFPAWSVSVEAFLYALFPLLLLLQQQTGRRNFMFLAVGLWMLSVIQHYYFSTRIYVPDDPVIGQLIMYFPLWHVHAFCMGMACAGFIRTNQGQLPRWKSRMLVGLGILGMLAVLGTDNAIKPFTSNGLLAPLYFCLVAGLATDTSILTRMLGNPVFLLLGNASYAMYLFQWPVYMGYRAMAGMEKPAGWHFYLYLLTLTGCSILVYLSYEKRLRTWIVARWGR